MVWIISSCECVLWLLCWGRQLLSDEPDDECVLLTRNGNSLLLRTLCCQ
jgi:hypothetical protein